MSTETRQGKADHRALELFERMARVATENGTTIYRFEREAIEEIILDAARRWWSRRGYQMQEVHRGD